MGKYDEVSVVRQLNNVGAVIGINSASKVIKVAKNSSIGNGTSGKIDFLTHYCGYYLEYVDVIQQQKNVMKRLLLRKLLKRLLVKLNLQRIILLKVLLVLLINVCVLLKENSMLWLVLNSHLEL